MAKSYGLRPGEAMDLTNGWDFTLKRHQEAALTYVEEMRPKLIIGSPECTMFSSLQTMNKKYWSRETKVRYMEAVEHIKFVVKLYRKQVEAGRWFLHEHPAGASS